jgi:hypothetical protein
MSAHHAFKHQQRLPMATSTHITTACDKPYTLLLQQQMICSLLMCCSSCKHHCLHLAIICMRAHDCKELARWVQQLLSLQMADIAMYAGRETISKAAVAVQAAML